MARKIRHARLLRDLSQADIAARAECTQAAISRIETGDFSAVSSGTLLRVCSLLGVAANGEVTEASNLSICPNAGCLHNAPFQVRGQIHFLPKPVKKTNATTRFCFCCGGELIDKCPQCKAAVQPGATFCPECGKAYIETPPEVSFHPDPHAYEEAFARRGERLKRHLAD